MDRQPGASYVRGGTDAEIVSMQRAWFRCPRCQRDWEVRIDGPAWLAVRIDSTIRNAVYDQAVKDLTNRINQRGK